MKTILKLTSIATAIAAIATGTALADHGSLQNLLALDRARNASAGAKTTTVAVYAKDRAFGRTPAPAAPAAPAEAQHELRSTSHGQTFGVVAPSRK